MTRPVAIALTCGAFVGLAAAPPPSSPQDLARLTREAQILEKQTQLAQGKQFYLILDPRSGTLKMLFNATELTTYAVKGIEIGGPRVAFVSRALPTDWEGRIWSSGELDPPRERDRLEIQAPPPTADGQEPNTPVPPTPEEAYP